MSLARPLLAVLLGATAASAAAAPTAAEERFNARVLAVHNAERAAVGAPPLRWDDTLAEHAKAYAEHLAQTRQLVHSPRAGRGIERENLQVALPDWTPERMVQDWMDEKRLFHAGIFPNICSPDWSQCSHYTQVIWPATTSIGCGVAQGGGYQWFVCRYSPGGNKDGQLVGAPPGRASGRG